MYKSFVIFTIASIALIQPVFAQKRKIAADSLVSAEVRKSALFSHEGSIDIVGEGRMNKGLVLNSLDALSGQAVGVNISSSAANRGNA